MRIAIEGCCHGDLDQIYDSLTQIERESGKKIDLLLCCGDFQALRNESDMDSLAVPPKYRDMKDFHKYWRGEKKAPVLTIFIGGNHEASNFMLDLYYGGWVCENIYYMGHSSVINVNGLRIGGMSGIFNNRHHLMGLHERPPFTEDTKRSVYHVRKIETEKLKLVSSQNSTEGPIDIFLSHDWPRDVWNFGDVEQLLRRKDRTGEMRREMSSGTFGNPAAMDVMRALKPAFWFSAHHHVKFSALVDHGKGDVTRFLSLDKCLPGRDFLQVLEIEPGLAGSNRNRRSRATMKAIPKNSLFGLGTGLNLPQADNNVLIADESDYTTPLICYDAEWLAILRKNISKINRTTRNMPTFMLAPTKEEIEKMRRRLNVFFKDENNGLSSGSNCNSDNNLIPIPYDPTQTANTNYASAQRRRMSELLHISDIWDTLESQPLRQFPLTESGEKGSVITSSAIIVDKESQSDSEDAEDGAEKSSNGHGPPAKKQKAEEKPVKNDAWLLGLLDQQ